MAAPEPFATPVDYESRGYDPDSWASSAVLETKLAEASRYLRSRGAYPRIDQDIEDGVIDVELVKDVVCAMVGRAAPVESVPMGADSMQMGVDIFQRTVKFGGGGANQMYLTKEDRRKLGIGRQRAVSIDLIPDVGAFNYEPFT